MIILLYFIKFSNWVDSSLMVKDLCCQQNTADSASGKVQSDQEGSNSLGANYELFNGVFAEEKTIKAVSKTSD